MPQWAGSCWYYLRFIDPNNLEKGWDPEKEKYWMPVDLYIGGAEHAVLHLLYSRFWHHVLYDLGLVSTKEPFKKLFNQGMILGSDGSKMSKSRGNVVNPDETVDIYGSDALRIYEMFMGPLEKGKPWSTSGLQGCSRFIKKLWSILVDNEGDLSKHINDSESDKQTNQILHQMIKKVSDNLEQLHFNTCVSEFMIFTNHIQKLDEINRELIRSFIVLLNPFMPHFAQELWELMRENSELTYEDWPKYDESFILQDEITIAVQLNGKRRSEINISKDEDKSSVLDKARSDERIAAFIGDMEVVKEIYIKDKIVNLVIK